MADKAIIDVDAEDSPKDPKTNSGQGLSKTTRKRKKSTLFLGNLSANEKEAHIEALQKELEGLFEYYKEVMNQKVVVELSECGSRNAVIAVMMEESELPLSSLVDEIYDKLRKKVENGDVHVSEPVTQASVKSSVLLVGQRLMYGAPNADADILEDHSESCLWCWETRDLKLIPNSVRGLFNVRRTCRRRIHERIIAVSETISSLKKLESEPSYSHDLIMASTKLGKACTEAGIRVLVDGLLQKNSVDMAKKKANQEDKLLRKQLEKNRREVEKENKSMHSELQKETSFSENDLTLLQGEATKDEKCCEKDRCEKRKQQKKQTEETEKDQRRREKEEAELKRKRCLQKQASVMERFLKRSKTSPSSQNDQVSIKSIVSDSSIRKSENVSESVTLSMDSTLASNSDITLEDIRKSHCSLWRNLGRSIRSNRKQGWGLRWKPKTELVKELKLTATKAVALYDELGMEKNVDGLEEYSSEIRSCPMNADNSLLDAKKCCQGKQLLQFDNGHKPAFYGIWLKKSHIVGPRHPFKKDPSLDYDVSSDEEWEEEEPGESLSDCDKDEEECLEECAKSDDESEDGFFVPDGYLSQDEGAQVDRVETDIDIEEAESSPSCKDDIECEEFYALLRQQKYLNNLTENALRKNQPLIIPNLMHDKEYLLLSDNLSGTPKLEQMFLQALSMCIIPGSSCIEMSMDKMRDEDPEPCLSTGKDGASPISNVASIPDSDLPLIVTTIQACPPGRKKVLESLQQKFPYASKSLLRNKVREMSDYVDNHWQVKKEVLVKLGLAVYPEKSTGGARNIATFFSKRCLPPAGESMKPGETSPSPLSSLKSCSADHERQQSSYNNP